MMLERVWIACCSRCANETWSHEETGDAAANELRARGWSDEDGSNYCWQCNVEASA